MQDQAGVGEAQGGKATEPVRGEDEKGQQVRLTLAPLDSTDMALIRMWRNDYRIWKWCRQNDLISDAEQAQWFQRQHADPSIKMYKIVLAGYSEKENQTKLVPVGVCGFTSIDHMNRRAEFSFYIAPPYQGQDLGRLGMSALLTHGFKNLGFHVIWGEVFDGNHALKLFEELGFRREGTRRDFYFRDGGFIDAHLISIKENEWKSI